MSIFRKKSIHIEKIFTFPYIRKKHFLYIDNYGDQSETIFSTWFAFIISQFYPPIPNLLLRGMEAAIIVFLYPTFRRLNN
ncbi:MAG: hypothetical protein A2V66_07500 [Ignavibacteria bacterium RBG_13_36_8]|nr:MAG: hypothetical protein A2V66_07500 [Ignavibacteria bacterium RBG_13_36_8]